MKMNSDVFSVDIYDCRTEVIFYRHDNQAGEWWCRATWRGDQYDSPKSLIDVKCKHDG